MQRFGDLAKCLNASRVIYATPTAFDAVAGVLRRAQEISAPARVYAWDGSTLLDSLADDRSAPDAPTNHLVKVAERLARS